MNTLNILQNTKVVINKKKQSTNYVILTKHDAMVMKYIYVRIYISRELLSIFLPFLNSAESIRNNSIRLKSAKTLRHSLRRGWAFKLEQIQVTPPTHISTNLDATHATVKSIITRNWCGFLSFHV